MIWELNGLTRNLNFWDFWMMSTEGSMEQSIKKYKKYRDVASVNENIIYHLVSAYLYDQWYRERRKPDLKPIKTAINYLGGVNSVGTDSLKNLIRLKIKPVLKTNLNDKNYNKIIKWLNQTDNS